MFEKCTSIILLSTLQKYLKKKKILGTRLFPFEIFHDGVEKGWDTSCSNYL